MKRTSFGWSVSDFDFFVITHWIGGSLDKKYQNWRLIGTFGTFRALFGSISTFWGPILKILFQWHFFRFCTLPWAYMDGNTMLYVYKIEFWPKKFKKCQKCQNHKWGSKTKSEHFKLDFLGLKLRPVCLINIKLNSGCFSAKKWQSPAIPLPEMSFGGNF